ncbi:MAG: hypothetical protein KAJ19_18460 [Gammaproteobacteria bacterium]|nr:hypothetical protein [Gammaproteobacteria bacterium]
MSNQWFLDQAREGNVFHAHNTTAGAVTVLNATCTGLILENPSGSGKILVMKNAQFSMTTIAAIATIGLAVSSAVVTAESSSTTAAVIHNGKLSGSNGRLGAGKAYSIATLASTPVWYREMGKLAITATVEAAAEKANLDGDTIVMPGTYICLATLTTARTGMASFTWAEVDR